MWFKNQVMIFINLLVGKYLIMSNEIDLTLYNSFFSKLSQVLVIDFIDLTSNKILDEFVGTNLKLVVRFLSKQSRFYALHKK